MKFAMFAAAALAAFAAPAAAQELIEAGSTVQGAPSQDEEPDLYVFTAGVASTVRFDLGGSGLLSLTLFTGAGDRMLEVTGSGSARLEAILPLTDAYMVAVARGDSAAGYTLSMSQVEPDPHLIFFARAVGYGYDGPNASGGNNLYRSCWIEPGVVYRYYINQLGNYHELLRGGREQGYYHYPGEPLWRARVTFEGDLIRRSSIYESGPREAEYRWSDLNFTPEDHADVKNFRYLGYMCDE